MATIILKHGKLDLIAVLLDIYIYLLRLFCIVHNFSYTWKCVQVRTSITLSMTDMFWHFFCNHNDKLLIQITFIDTQLGNICKLISSKHSR